MDWLGRAALLAAPVLAALPLVACAGASSPCDAHDACGEGLGCVAGRCLAPSADVVPFESKRLVLSATEIRTVSSRGDGDGPVVVLGAARTGETRMHLRFDSRVGPAVKVTRAYLVLSPEVASRGPMSPVEISVAPILSPWASGPLSWGRSPAMGLPVASTTIDGTPRAPIRFDVTSALDHSGAAYGLVVVGSGEDALGVRIDAPAGTTRGPRLELFLE